jgi:peptide/nickel transport system substrate-binding protein
MHYRLSTWADRDVQAVAGTGDYSNLEQPENYVEALQRAAQEDSPARLEFGPRTIGYSLYLNQSDTGWGEPDERQQAIRALNRDLNFRIAVTSALDRVRLGESLVKGPFTAVYPGGLYSASAYYDPEATVYYPYDPAVAAEYFRRAGLEDTDGDGFLNHPADVLGGANVQIALLSETDIRTNKNVAEAVIALMEEAGLQVVANFMSSNDENATRQAGQWDWSVFRNGSELVTVVQNTPQLAPTGPQTSIFHRAGPDGTMNLQLFEEELVTLVNAFIASNDPAERVQLMQDYQRIYTENVYGLGLTQYSAALIVNKRFANLPTGTPNFMFNWGEDSIMRERMYVPTDLQPGLELHPGTLPGAPGSPGPV